MSSVLERETTRNRFNSVDSVHTKKINNNLLKLSFLNSPRSPLHSSSMNSSALTDSVFGRKGKADLSYEDLNNISQQLIDTSNVSITDFDLEQLKISFLENNPLSPKADASTEKLTDIQETLKRIKMEDTDENIKIEEISPMKPPLSHEEGVKETKSEVEVENIFQKIKRLMKANNRNDAKKELKRLGEILSEQPKNLTVPTMVRQDTFDIDPKTGKRKYASNHQGDGDNSQNDLMEQLAKLLGTHSLDISSLNLSGDSIKGGETKVVVIMPKSLSPIAATPVKKVNPARRSVSVTSIQRPQSALKAIENKKLATPMKHTLTPAAPFTRRSFTAPKSVTKPPHTNEQKSSMGAVRKSLMPSMEKTPIKQNTRLSPNARPATSLATSVRRSVSLKSMAVPTVKLTEATPTKTRPMTSTATPSKLVSQNTKLLSTTTGGGGRRLSSLPSTNRSTISRTTAIKPPSSVNSRPVSRKSEFKSPYATSKKSKTAPNGSLV